MEDKIFVGYGIEIFKRDEHFFIRYDAGGIAAQFREEEVTAEEVAKAQKSEKDAYEVLLACQMR
jgi:hypothetical protein